ncbi:glycosyltransferase family 1 protein [Vibrio splendidus]|uniref:glycosyltransferase family 1 protein n=1 Tax=Vibrio splendidus TaxID=29497 RepID=UPI00021C0BA6|nr:glycosyltransferase family 1 protein [Vibrio splendidus]EGU40415.1 putative glycosyltransferase [Vibrio splendidus ATCC 33789]
MKESEANVLMLLKCNGLQYDDRVRKECESIFDTLNYTTEIHVLEDKNQKGSGSIFRSKSKFFSYKLFTRKLFKNNSLLLIKLLELFFYLLPSLLKKRKVVWLHDPLMFVFVPVFFLLKRAHLVESIVWDQHELPPSKFISNRLFRELYKWSLQHVDIRIHANKERAEHLNSLLGEKYSYKTLNNFVDRTFVMEEAQPIDSGVKNWLDSQDFVLLQSGAYEERNFGSVVEAFCVYAKQKCVVVGGSRVDLDSYRVKFKNFDDVFYFVGMVPQIRLVDYIDLAKYSLILYKSTTPNSLYCEANRLYQASSRGTFVVVGNNPPMQRFVSENKNGFVLSDDGSTAESILDMLENYDFNSVNRKKVISNWESQNSKFIDILGCE